MRHRPVNMEDAMREALTVVAKSVVVGASSLVPGVSGGTMAILLGIYDKLIFSISRFTSDWKKNLAFLAEFGIGAAAGILLLAKAVLWLFECFELPMMYLFIGLILGSVPMLFRQAGTKSIRLRDILWVLVGFTVVMLVQLIPVVPMQLGGTYNPLTFVMMVVAGVVVAVAFILPGISTSYMLLILGIYDITLRAVTELDFLFLLPLMLGAIVGTLVTARLLEIAMRRHTCATYMTIIGFVIGSILDIMPQIPMGWNIVWCLLAVAVGFGAVSVISRYGD